MKELWLTKDHYKYVRVTWIFAMAMSTGLPAVVIMTSIMMPKMLDSSDKNERLPALVISIVLFSIIMCIYIIVLIKFINFMSVPKKEKKLMEQGRIIEGKVVKLELRREASGSNSLKYGNAREDYFAIYEYQEEGKTVKRRSPKYFSLQDKDNIITNDYKVKIAVLNGKSCICNFY